MRVVSAVVLAALSWAQSTQGGLIHRYNFNETAGTVVTDVVGGANGD